jgi:mRNA-degrading endonuclease YafQ of YafQ-DinJ toxin-antitoxin module
MRFRYLGSFDRSFRKLSAERRKRVAEGVEAFLDFYRTGIRPPGLGLKKLRKDFWEIRADSDTRIIFVTQKDCVTFALVGNHDEIRRFLRET